MSFPCFCFEMLLWLEVYVSLWLSIFMIFGFMTSSSIHKVLNFSKIFSYRLLDDIMEFYWHKFSPSLVSIMAWFGSLWSVLTTDLRYNLWKEKISHRNKSLPLSIFISRQSHSNATEHYASENILHSLQGWKGTISAQNFSPQNLIFHERTAQSGNAIGEIDFLPT